MTASHATTRRSSRRARRRGSVIIVVLWAIAIAAFVASAVQLSAYRQAAMGRDTSQRVQARWAARGGLENAISMMAIHTENPSPDDAFAIIRDLVQVSAYNFHGASYNILYDAEGTTWGGPLDEHSRLNINGASLNQLAVLEDMTDSVAAAIRDWRDDDDDPGLLGAESDYYQGMWNSYKPRNGAFRHVAELELVAGIWGDFVRGEDWNLNNRMDPNEDDGARTIPDDQPDGYLETGWGGRLTVHSVDGGATESGLPRIYLRRAEPVDVMNRCGLASIELAENLIAFGQSDQNRLEQLITIGLGGATDVTGGGGPGGGPGGGGGGSAGGSGDEGEERDLTDDQLRAILAETSVLPLYERPPGRVNLNTASPDLLTDLLEILGINQIIADEIIYRQLNRAEGITSILELQEIQGVTPSMLETLSEVFTTTSNVYTVASRGRSVSGVEIEIIAVVDRSSVPVRILEYREQ